MKLFGTMKINNNGHLSIGGYDVVDLAEEYGTPLYVVDEALVRNNCQVFKNNFSMNGIDTEVAYASKAFLNLAMCKLVAEEGLSLDVVSGGELYTALKANFPPAKIYFHGNNKTVDELTMALKAGVGRIVVDNRQEMRLLEQICEQMDKTIDVLLRVNPGIEAHTHEYIQTSKYDSKFGESIFNKDIYQLIDYFQDSNRINLKGFHCHIGSQIFQEESFYLEIKTMMRFIQEIKDHCGFITKELNLGGGFGVYNSSGDNPVVLEQFLPRMCEIAKDEAISRNLHMPKLIIEPGRSITCNAGITIYKIGFTKTTFNEKNYIFVNGGMTDNIRPALYDASYDAAIANKMNDDRTNEFTIAGKCCESGDVLIKNIKLPQPEKNDLLVVFNTGAYNYSMASNYNRLAKPAVIFVNEGQARIVVKRETYEDLIRNDLL